MANITISGSVSAQFNSGETVTVTLTKPDLTTETLTAITQEDKSFSVTKTYIIAGAYSYIVSIAADPQYSQAVTVPTNFTIELTTRTITTFVAIN